ncbi:MAG: anthranilate synthase component I [Chloroflexota bacterium]|nr:anthranilate synthase component I [Chloroflexota bacterium]
MAAEQSQDESGGAAPYTLVSRRISADLDTPVSALLKIKQGEHCFLLESVERGSQVGRYSFLGTDPHALLTAKGGSSTLTSRSSTVMGTDMGHVQTLLPTGGANKDPLAEMERLLSARRLVMTGETTAPYFGGGAVGYAGYEIASSLEPVKLAANDPLGLPDMAFAFYDTLLVFDHVQRAAQVVTQTPLTGDPDHEYAEAVRRIEKLMRRLRRPVPATVPQEIRLPGSVDASVSSNHTQAAFEIMVRQAKEHIEAGDIIQVVLSQRFERQTGADPFSVYRALRMVNPSPYMFFLQFGDTYLVGASPEMLVQVRGSKVTTHPIAGTRSRGKSRQEDANHERDLLADEKERAEHLMLVDLGRNDIGRIAEIGSVKVPRFMQVDHYSHVMHLVSEVEGELKRGLGPVDALRACFPAGTVSGAPKVRAMQIISELEGDRRGPYAGAAGYIGYDGNMDTAITIRTLVIKDGVASVQAGAGIVADSVPESEFRETEHKAQALLSAITLAEEIETEERDALTATQMEKEETPA